MSSIVLIWSLSLLVASLVFAIFAMQGETRQGWSRCNIFRLTSFGLAAGSGGWVGMSLVNLWYSYGTAPDEVWRGALWIGACVVSGFTLAAIVNIISTAMPDPGVYRGNVVS